MMRSAVVIAMTALAVILRAGSVPAATNQATDPGGGGVSLTSSSLVTVNPAALQLVKQVWDTSGNCLASSPAAANCNSSATSVTVGAGTTLKFLIFVRNTTDVAVTEVRFQDLLDNSAAGFTYVGPTRRTANDATAPFDTAPLTGAGGIFPAADGGTIQTPAVGAPDDFASIDTGLSPNRLTVGAVAGQANQSLGFSAHRSFAILFWVTKN